MIASKDPADTDPAAYRAYQQLLRQVRSLVMATTNSDGSALASYTPFIMNEQRQFYVFISQLAAHTRNLQRTGQAGVLLIEDESAGSHVFARTRATFQCRAQPVPLDGAEGQAVLAEYQTQFGEIVGLLRSLPDFQLFKLQPLSGSLVLGFGQAHELSGDRFDSLSHRQSG